jgi:hypothetical protein
MTKSRGRGLWARGPYTYMVTNRVQFVDQIHIYKQRKRKDKFKLGMITIKRKWCENGRQESCKIVTSVFSLQLLVWIFLRTVFFILVYCSLRLLQACTEDNSCAYGWCLDYALRTNDGEAAFSARRTISSVDRYSQLYLTVRITFSYMLAAVGLFIVGWNVDVRKTLRSC